MTTKHNATSRYFLANKNKVCTSLSYNKRWPQMCCRPIKVFRDGIGYCGIHDPVHQEEMQRKRDAKQS